MDGVMLRQRLQRFPQLSYEPLPTLLQPLPRLTHVLGGPQLWIKRDDELGPGMGGNKGRKLAFLMADALQKRKRKVVTFGGVQSNHARMTAAACAALGLQAHLFFFEKRPFSFEGNLLLNKLLGAKMHFIPFGHSDEPTMTLEQTNRLVRLVSALWVGPWAYFIPVGGHNVTGCLGYVAAALELQEQVLALGLDLARVTIVTAVGTGGTLAGLLAGLHLLQSPMQVLGIDVGKLWQAFPTSLAHLTGALCTALGQPQRFSAQDIPMIEERYVGPHYAAFTTAAAEAIGILAQNEGVLLDPVYSGKAFAGMLELIDNGRFAKRDHVIFLHTGGHPGLWAYTGAFARVVAER